MNRLVAFLVLALAAMSALAAMKPAELGVVVNTDDPWSEEIARYYVEKRDIPAENVARVKLGDKVAISRTLFDEQKKLLDQALPARVKGLALAFAHPLEVDYYNSITSAFSYGYHLRDPAAPTSDLGYANPYPRKPMRISMMLTGLSLAHVKALIDRGVASDRTNPEGEFLCMSTSDRIRSVRCNRYSPGPEVTIVRSDTVGKRNILGYFQGLAVIPEFSAEFPPGNAGFRGGNRFVPGAWADNLTSAGAIEGAGQTTVWQMLAAGATGSYGTIEEPYALPGKFPDPATFVRNYRAGDTLIEAAWKSVAYPYQGLFVGEPLANPWMRER
jgi:uncharacterized protein (TIGR03790 family)